VQWLRNHGEDHAADWFEKYWTGDSGNYMLAHSEIGSTNSNNGTGGNWGGLQKAICGTAESNSGLAVQTVVPSLFRFLSHKSKEEASFWRRETETLRENQFLCI
jgi:hypothetical protein